CLDELRRTAPQVDELKAELVNRVQEVESQLVEEQSELFATRRAVTKATEDEHLLQAAEEELTKELAALHQRYDEAQMTVQSQKTDLMARQREERCRFHNPLLIFAGSTLFTRLSTRRAEERLEDNKVLYRSAREDAIKLQDEIDKLQESAARQHESLVKSASDEREKLQDLLKSNSNSLTTAQAEVARVKAENARLEAQLHDDPEKLEMKSRIQELEDTSIKARNASTIKIQALEGKLSVSEATIKELRSSGDLHAQQLSTAHTQKENLVEEIRKLTLQLEASQKAELNNMTVITNLQQSNENLVALQEQERERAQAAQLAHQASKFDLQTTLKDRDERIRLFKEENTKLIQADQAPAEDIKSTRGIASEIAKAQESVASHNIAQEVENTTKELQMQIKALTERNSFLKEQAATMVQRHKDGRLNAEEAALVKEVIQSTLQIGERDSIQKANDIKRRDVIIQTLQARVQDLEKQLATQLDKRSAGQLMTTKDIWSSSPLTQPDDGINKTDQQRSKQPIDATTSTTVHVHKHVTTDTRQDQGTFSHLNRESSEEHDADEIRPFSDPISTTKKRNISQDIVEAVMNEDGYPKSPERRLSRSPIRRALKRGRESASFDADAGTTADTSGTANVRATRKQKKSLGAQEGENDTGGSSILTGVGLRRGNRNAGNGGEAASNAVAVARYKAAQRGKLRR
ncbi:SubName: Full=Uncharacterized protein {ECO:0000313/EMBL:CCA75226.1}, partial [Serendipita indica DSM 11827]